MGNTGEGMTQEEYDALTTKSDEAGSVPEEFLREEYDAPRGQAGLDALRAQTEKLEAENQAGLARLQSQGMPLQVQLPNMIQFGVLLDMVLGDQTSSTRWLFELKCQQALAAQIEQAGAQVNRARLLAPASPPPQPNGARIVFPGR